MHVSSWSELRQGSAFLSQLLTINKGHFYGPFSLHFCAFCLCCFSCSAAPRVVLMCYLDFLKKLLWLTEKMHALDMLYSGLGYNYSAVGCEFTANKSTLYIK